MRRQTPPRLTIVAGGARGAAAPAPSADPYQYLLEEEHATGGGRTLYAIDPTTQERIGSVWVARGEDVQDFVECLARLVTTRLVVAPTPSVARSGLQLER